jgi:hypothetical protein
MLGNVNVQSRTAKGRSKCQGNQSSKYDGSPAAKARCYAPIGGTTTQNPEPLFRTKKDRSGFPERPF